MFHALQVWYACIVNCISRQMEYRADFIGTFIVETTFQFVTVIFFDVIFGHITDLGGWSRGEVLVFLGSVLFIDATMMMTLYKNLISLPEKINRGELDFYLLKPIDAQFFVSVRYFMLPSALQMLTAAGIVVYGLNVVGWTFAFWPFLLYLLMMVNGLLLIYGTWLCFQSMSFWLQASQGFEHAFFMFSHFYQKPDAIYKGTMRVILTFVLPAVVIASFPAQVLLGKGLSIWMVLWCFAATGLYLAFSRWLFKQGLKRYESASS